MVVSAVAAATVSLAACGSTSPTRPSQSPTPSPADPTPAPPPQPTAPNAPPTVTLSSTSPRVEEDNEVAITAAVVDTETPVDQMTYEWSAAPNPGQFIGTGRQVRWRAPRLQPTPDLYTITLTVTEKYTQNGEPKENKATATLPLHYNDSYREINRITFHFLTELFPNYSVTPQQAVQDFTDSCIGKSAELADITVNRANFHILSGTYTNVTITPDKAMTTADVSGTCTFTDIPTDPKNPNYGKTETVTGVCMLNAVYENWKWYLCSSRFKGIGTTVNSFLYRVPGQIVP